MNNIVGTHHFLFVTLDTLRFDVAQQAHQHGLTPAISSRIGDRGWEERHAPANFTYASHQAFFAGFLPTPVAPGRHPRLFATAFPGSETTTADTCVFDQPTIVQGMAARGYRTHCIGGVGFFNKKSALGSVLPQFFQHSYWSEELGVTCPDSADNQVALALDLIGDSSRRDLMFLFINVSAIHQPNCCYRPGATSDCRETQLDALAYVDRAFTPLFNELNAQTPWFVILCSDHGTAYGEDGYHGHRLNHPVVNNVPYADFICRKANAA